MDLDVHRIKLVLKAAQPILPYVQLESEILARLQEKLFLVQMVFESSQDSREMKDFESLCMIAS
jgi:hypothetical protein